MDSVGGGDARRGRGDVRRRRERTSGPSAGIHLLTTPIPPHFNKGKALYNSAIIKRRLACVREHWCVSTGVSALVCEHWCASTSL